MIDFTASLQIGLSAAEKAEENRTEISSVFQELNNQLGAHTQGKIQIHRAEFYASSNPFRITLFEKRPTYWALAAQNPLLDDQTSIELAKWKQDPAGYPCEISLTSQSFYCEDKESLESALSELLKDSSVGEVLHKLMTTPVLSIHQDDDDKKMANV